MPAPVAGMFYQAVVCAVLLYGSEYWVLPRSQLARLEGFHVECARRLTGMRPRKVGGKWLYPKSATVLRAARLQPLHHYIQKRRATVAKTIDGRPVLEECRGAERLRGTPVRQTWWEQELSPPPEPKKEARGGSPWHGGGAVVVGAAPQASDGMAMQPAGVARRRTWPRRGGTGDGFLMG